MKSILNKKYLTITLMAFCLKPSLSLSVERVQVLPYKYDEVWRGVLIALSKYPLKKNNQEIGLIETDLIKGTEIWSPPHKEVNQNLRYKLTFRLYDGKSNNKYATKVTVEKNAYIKSDFLDKNKIVESDGFEEAALIYRASREVLMNKIADKKFNAPQQRATRPTRSRRDTSRPSI